MSRVSCQLSFAAFALISLATASNVRAQVSRRAAPVPPAGSTEQSGRVTLALAVGNQRYDEAKLGQCKHAPQASIYGTAAAMWTVQYSPSANGSIALTLWRPVRSGTTAQVMVDVRNGSVTHRISTVKGGKLVGRATVSFKQHGAGGRFDIDGATADGVAIRGSIDCERFSALTAEGGN